MPVLAHSNILKINVFYCTNEHERPIVSSKAHSNNNQSSSNHKMESEPTQAGNFWKMWILHSWKGNTNILQLLDLEKKKSTERLC